MIENIDYLKPDGDSHDVISEFIKKVAEYSQGKGCFTYTAYHGENSVVAQSIIIHLAPYDQTGKLYPLGGYMWLVKVDYTAEPKEVDSLKWYSITHGGKVIHNIDVTFIEP